MIFDTHYMHEKQVDIGLSNQHKNNSFLMINLDTAGQSVPILLSQNTSQLGVSVFNHVNVNVTNLYSTYA